MKFYNTLGRKIEEFKSIKKNEVTLYTCGPTVYDNAHIGNLRTYIFQDLLKRALMEEGYRVNHVMNVTDVDDKTIEKSNGIKSDFTKNVKKYEEEFFIDCKKINIIPPDIVTRPTEYIEKIVKFIEELIEKGYAYKADDDSTYFSIDKFKDYGKLSKLNKEGIKAGARVSQDEYEKENPADFALWKAWDENDGEIFWDPSTWLGAGTSLGKGRPGWHIECSTMATDVLGPTIDIHSAAVDLIFPHNENEIAQAEAKNGKQFVNYWIHGEHLLVDGKKMSKSLNNFYTLDDIISKGFDPLDFRYLVASSHYRSKLNFTWRGLQGARNARIGVENIISPVKDNDGTINQSYYKKFVQKIEDDLNTPEALAVVFEIIDDKKIEPADRFRTINKINETLDIFNFSKNVPEEIERLAEERKRSRTDKDFEQSDQLRKKINAQGWEIEDLANNEYELKEKKLLG